MSFFLYIILLTLLPLLLLSVMKSKPKNNLPPGPLSLPIIGNLHQLGQLPHRSLDRLSKKHGPFMYLKLGQIQTFIASSPKIAEEILKTHDHELCSRPSLTNLVKLSYGGRDMAFSPYNDQWKQLRRLSMLHFFSPKRVQSFKPIREEEVNIFLQTISKSMLTKGQVNMSEMSLCLFNNIIFREVFGKRISEDGDCSRSRVHDLAMEIQSLMGGLCFGDLFPGMKWLDVFTCKRLEKSFKGMNELFEREIEEHLDGDGHGKEDDNGVEDFLRILLKIQGQNSFGAPGFLISKDHIKALLMNMLTGGTGTSASMIEWGMTELLRNPRVMEKAQHEVRQVTKNKGKVEESDLHQLHYLKLVINEVLRLHPPGPLLIPRQCMKDCSINGYNVPAKAMVYVNAWTIGRDCQSWNDAEEFLPERFENSPVSYKGHDFQLIPFGAGRRICPGMSLGLVSVELAFARILYSFNWSLPEGMLNDDIDMEECFGISSHKKVPLILVAKPVAPM